MAVKYFTDVTSPWPFVGEVHLELVPALDHCDFPRLELDNPALCGDRNVSQLGNDEEVPVGVAHHPVSHGFVSCVHVDCEPRFRLCASAAPDRAQAVDEVRFVFLGREGIRIPSVALGGGGQFLEVTNDILVLHSHELGVLAGGNYAIKPDPLIVCSWGGKRCATKLLGV
eukprot:CAMPEP_0170171986 /NCGR_PEP_ID=MMETSP0040_2-20121228/5188_1 /TAXON_ID=641309 /ORGANISM="Lotharella oceanica, Strain CCMP622" /LENGTH=169 /DNA_ID=CAMNT_0010412371 /DNA_START=878 /DNA_END=1387 /DNA_ORIENTATION=-